jgi:hypothetical protein
MVSPQRTNSGTAQRCIVFLARPGVLVDRDVLEVEEGRGLHIADRTQPGLPRSSDYRSSG